MTSNMRCECRHPKDAHHDSFDQCGFCDCLEFRREGSRETVNGLVRSVDTPQPKVSITTGDETDEDAPGDAVADLITRARKSDVKAIVKLAEKADAAVAKLRERMDEDAEAAKVRAEIAALERKLSAARAKLRGGTDTKAAKLTGQVRACDQCDRTFDSGQGLAMHRRRAHEGFDPMARAS